MKILVYGINYTPEITGIGKYTGEMAPFFAAAGHQVTVITAPPYYPNWEVAEAYRGKGWLTEELDGVTVHRVPLYLPTKLSGLKRILHEASFLLSSMRYWVPAYFRSYDAIVCVSPPIHLVLPALIHKWLRGTPIVNHVQDLQVDVARDMKIITNQPLLRFLEWLEKRLLLNVNKVSSISAGMIRKIQEKGVPAGNVIFFPNWVDSTNVFPHSREESLRAEWGFTDADKIILYSGNLGGKQGLGSIIEVAELLQDREEILFVIVGEGEMKAQLMAATTAAGLDNVQFKPLQPLNKLAACLASADVHLVLQRKAAANLVMPSKLTNILAVDGHAIVTAEPGTTLYDVVAENQLGTLVEPESPQALREGIEAIIGGEKKQDILGARHFVRNHLLKDKTLNTFLGELSRLDFKLK
jgi:colanic acid biosynthesis glycosyl transferase WcaI